MLLQKLNRGKGFTLIELMICIVIIAILAVMIIPTLIAFLEGEPSEVPPELTPKTDPNEADPAVPKEDKGELNKL